jgi:hypothetical protein
VSLSDLFLDMTCRTSFGLGCLEVGVTLHRISVSFNETTCI